MGGKVSAASFRNELSIGIADLQEVLDFTEVKAIGESREDDQRRLDMAKALTPFEQKQGTLNGYLRTLKAAANKVQEFKGAKDYEGCKEAQAGRKAYKDAKGKFEPLLKELKQIHEEFKQRATEAAKNPNRDESEVKEEMLQLKDQTTILVAFDDHIEKVESFMNTKKRDVGTQGNTGFGISADELGNLPDLDPASKENYKKFMAKDKEIDGVLEEIYQVNKEMLEIARRFHEEDKKADALVEQNSRDVARLNMKAQIANNQIEEVAKAIDGAGIGKICVYITILSLIMAVAYSIYTVASGEDPCQQADSSSNQDCV